MSDSAQDNIQWYAQTLRDWFLKHGRKLPWREAPTPYEVWVSELMLQQTQVVTVLPYYARWLERFPTVEALARADISEVLQLWAGLGYYRRARFLHEGAQIITQQFGGNFPTDIKELKKIRGIGSYTAGAIASFAFHQNTAAIDGNVERVMARFFGISGDLSRGKTRQALEATANAVAACGHASDTNQAMMDLGTSACAKIAHCESCPLSQRCFAVKHGLTESPPEKKTPPQKSQEFRACLILTEPDGNCLIARRRSDLLLGGLWEFPMITLSKDSPDPEAAVRLPRHHLWDAALSNIPQHWKYSGHQVSHIFTHIKMTVLIDTAHCESLAPLLKLQTETYDAFDTASLKDLADTHAISTLMKKLARAATARQPQPKLPI